MVAGAATAGVSAAGASAGGASAGGASAGGGPPAPSSGGAGTKLYKKQISSCSEKIIRRILFNLRSSVQSQLAWRSTHNIRTINTGTALLALLRILSQLCRIRRVNHHNLAQLAMWAGRTVQEHGLSARNGHIESPNFGLAIFKGDVAAVHASIHGSACGVSGGLSDSMVAI